MTRWGTRITKRSKLLCPDGCGLQRVTHIDPASFAGNPIMTTRVELECGHRRGEILPSRPGAISFEQITTKVGKQTFQEEA